jgi:hypothetical protein
MWFCFHTWRFAYASVPLGLQTLKTPNSQTDLYNSFFRTRAHTEPQQTASASSSQNLEVLTADRTLSVAENSGGLHTPHKQRTWLRLRGR